MRLQAFMQCCQWYVLFLSFLQWQLSVKKSQISDDVEPHGYLASTLTRIHHLFTNVLMHIHQRHHGIY